MTRILELGINRVGFANLGSGLAWLTFDAPGSHGLGQSEGLDLLDIGSTLQTMSEPSALKPAKVTYVEGPNFTVYAADGGFVKPTGSGNIVIEFFVGRYDYYPERWVPSQDGKSLNTEVSAPDELAYTRLIQVGVAMNKETSLQVAKNIINTVQPEQSKPE